MRGSGQEVAVAIVDEHRDYVCDAVCNRQIGLLVAGQVN
jgi:hypothetical protein